MASTTKADRCPKRNLKTETVAFSSSPLAARSPGSACLLLHDTEILQLLCHICPSVQETKATNLLKGCLK